MCGLRDEKSVISLAPPACSVNWREDILGCSRSFESGNENTFFFG